MIETITPIVQRQEALEEDEPIQAKCVSCEEEEQVQRSPNGVPQVQTDLENRLNASKGGGSPLPDEVRSFMEPRFNSDFKDVRVHTGSDAIQMNRDLSAQAFTHKQNIYFGAGREPGNDPLTAHELTHVIQQTGDIQPQSQTRSKDNHKDGLIIREASPISVTQQNINAPSLQRWVAPTDWLDYVGLGIDVIERAYIELFYEEGREKDLRRFENTLFFAIDLVLAALPGAGGGGLAVRGSRRLAAVGWGAIPESAKLQVAEQVAKQMGWSVTKALQMINLFMSANKNGESDFDDGERRGGGGKRRGGKKDDIKQIESVSKEFKMTPEQRREFGDFVEEQKARGRHGTKNERGDFTYQELRELAREFLGQ